MKKIFAYILAVAAFVSCSTDVNEVVAPSATLTAPMEISVGESRVFDADLNWSWETSDIIVAYQKADGVSGTINMLTLNEAGNFYNPAFEYATDAPAAFHFLYPVTAITERGLTVEQTGKWSPVLYGVAENTTISNIGTVEMNYLSSAFEVRVWANGRTERKNIAKAVITSTADFVPSWDLDTYTQDLDGKELSLDVNGDTAIFNLGEGDFAFTLTLTDTEGKVWTKDLPAKNFVAGKRTILNVEWTAEAVIEASVTSWYEDYATNKGTALEGGAIYVTAVGGTPVVTVDGVEATVVDGKVSGVATGTHNVVVTINGNEVENRSVVVTSIPTVSATIRTSYSSNGAEKKTNSIDGKALQVTTSLNDSALSSYVSTCQVAYGSTFANCTLNGESNFTVPVGAYNCYVKVALKNGYVCQSQAYTTYVTGIPYSFQFYQQSSNDAITSAGWTRNGSPNMEMELLCLRSGGLAGSNSGWVASPAYYIPTGLTAKVTLQSKYYVAAVRPSGQKASIYVGTTTSQTSSSSAAQTITISGSNDTNSANAWNTNSLNVSMPTGTQYISINHNGATYYLGSRIYVVSYKIEY